MADPKETEARAFAEAVGKYLAAMDWRPAVVGETRITRRPGLAKMNYTLEVDFTGAAPPDVEKAFRDA